MGLRRKLFQGEKVKLWDGFFRDTSIIFNSVLFVGVGAALLLRVWLARKIHSKRSFKRHYSDRLQLICQSCHTALHESLISQEKPCEEGNSTVLFIALRLPRHPGTAVDQRRQNKNSSLPLRIYHLAFEGRKTAKRENRKRHWQCGSSEANITFIKIYTFITCVLGQNHIKGVE